MADRLIEQNDMRTIKELAIKYNMSVADFGRSIVRVAERNPGRSVRLSREEYKHIYDVSKRIGCTMTQFCSMACHSFLNEKNKRIDFITDAAEKTNRTCRIEVRILNTAEDAELLKYATEYSMKISTLIRYCAVHFDGRKLI
ncbi:hypothetical protein OBV_p-00270 (plasmid) [Oscillibacter valericigenes Sjm18-20]|nr:hypothetical protein OBV_p-00270 [Oscillibacter valericigenes Sjm18-20]